VRWGASVRYWMTRWPVICPGWTRFRSAAGDRKATPLAGWG
jgi:hypothetical protein